MNDYLVVKDNDEITKAIEEVSGGIYSANLSNPESGDMVIYLGNYYSMELEAEDNDEINEVL